MAGRIGKLGKRNRGYLRAFGVEERKVARKLIFEPQGQSRT